MVRSGRLGTIPRRTGALPALILLLTACGGAPAGTLPDLTTSPAAPTVAEPTEPPATPDATPEPTPVDHSEGTGPWILHQAVYGGVDVVDLGLVRPDGSDAHRIPGGPGNRWHPDWSPDGTRIAYDYELPNGTSQIGMIDLDNGEEIDLTECVEPCFGHSGPAWSPDGRLIGFDGWDGPTGDSNEVCYLALLDLETGETRRILEWPDCDQDQDADDRPLSEGIRMRFSPDGEHIVFMGEGPRGDWAIFTATVDGADVRQLTEWGMGSRPDWSPDGDWIVFHDVEPEHHMREEVSLYRVRVDGTDLQRLTTPGDAVTDLYARYLPDGSAILYSRCLTLWECETRMIDPDGSDDRLLFGELAQQTVHVMMQPDVTRD